MPRWQFDVHPYFSNNGRRLRAKAQTAASHSQKRFALAGVVMHSFDSLPVAAREFGPVSRRTFTSETSDLRSRQGNRNGVMIGTVD